MITVTRFNGPTFSINPDLIERIEATPDTVLHMVNGNDYVVRETVDEIVARIRESRAAVIALSHMIEQRSAGTPTLRVVPDGREADRRRGREPEPKGAGGSRQDQPEA